MPAFHAGGKAGIRESCLALVGVGVGVGVFSVRFQLGDGHGVGREEQRGGVWRVVLRLAMTVGGFNEAARTGFRLRKGP